MHTLLYAAQHADQVCFPRQAFEIVPSGIESNSWLNLDFFLL